MTGDMLGDMSAIVNKNFDGLGRPGVRTGYRADVSRLAANLLAVREQELDITQEEFGRRVGLARSQVSTYETGREKPSALVLNRIAERLGKDPKSLDPDGEVYSAKGPRRKQTDEPRRLTSRQSHNPKEVTVDDPRRYEFVSLFDSLVRNPQAQEELVVMVRRYVARKLAGPNP